MLRRPPSLIEIVRKKIGIFQYEWPMQIHTVNLAARLAGHGFEVDVYLYQCESAYVDLPALVRDSGVGVHQFRRSLAERIADRLVRDARRLLGLEYRHPDRIGKVAARSLASVAANGAYDYFIGVEKAGLVWAGMLAEQLGVPFLYYSLELHIEGHPAFEGKRDFVSIRKQERKYHARAAATIVQDELRGRALLDSNGIVDGEVIYIPVSVTGPRVETQSRFLHRKLGIDPAKEIVLYIGQVSKARGAIELMECAARLGDDRVLVLHGPVFAGVPTDDDHGGKVYFSREIIDSAEIPEMVSSAHIGIAFYPNDIINDRLTAFSSEKIAYYMQCGLPLIAYANESYELLMRQHRCGELVDRIGQVPEAVARIDADYANYRASAFAAYDRFYSFDANVSKLVGFLSRDV